MVAAAVSRELKQLARIPRLLERAIQAGKQFAADNRLLNEIRSAGLHGFHRHWHVAAAGDDDRGKPVASVVKPAKQLNSAHSREVGIKQKASFSSRAIGSEKILGARKNFDSMAIVFEHGAHRFTYFIDRHRQRRRQVSLDYQCFDEVPGCSSIAR